MSVVTTDAADDLAASVAAFERGFEVVEVYSGGPQPAYAPTGDLYCEHRHGPCGTPQEVISQWAKDATALRDAAPAGSVLYWRVRPEIAYGNNFSTRTKGWMIYSRFIISNKQREG